MSYKAPTLAERAAARRCEPVRTVDMLAHPTHVDNGRADQLCRICARIGPTRITWRHALALPPMP